MWLSMGTCCGGTQDFDPWVLFDLGAVYTINSIHVWNYNEATGGNLTERGVNEVAIEYGLTEALGSTVPGITNFTQAPEPVTNTYPAEVSIRSPRSPRATSSSTSIPITTATTSSTGFRKFSSTESRRR